MFNVVELGEKLVDPDNNDVLGYQGIYVGQGRIDRTGDPGTLRMLETEREAVVGNLLMEEEDVARLNFLPRSPDNQIEGRIISVLSGVSLIGQYQVVVINRGSEAGLEPGHVLRAYQAGAHDSRHATWRFRRESPFAGRAGGHDDGVPHVGTLELCPRHGSHVAVRVARHRPQPVERRALARRSRRSHGQRRLADAARRG